MAPELDLGRPVDDVLLAVRDEDHGVAAGMDLDPDRDIEREIRAFLRSDGDDGGLEQALAGDRATGVEHGDVDAHFPSMFEPCAAVTRARVERTPRTCYVSAPMEIRDARFLASAHKQADLPAPAFAEIAFAGRSNVGKSSLINSLVARRKLVRTSSTPGCTRGINLFRVDLKDPDAVLDLVDLPGYGYAQRSKSERRSWGTLIETFLRDRPGLRGVVVILDARRDPEEDDRELITFLEHVKREPIVVATKLDKLPASKRKRRLAEIGNLVGRRVVGYSAEENLGRDDLWRVILRVASIGAEESASSH